MRHWAVAIILILLSLCPLGINTLTDRNLQLENRGYDLVALAGSSAGLSLDHVLLTSFSSDTYPSIINPFAFTSSAVSGTVMFSCTNPAIGLLTSSATCGDGFVPTKIVTGYQSSLQDDTQSCEDLRRKGLNYISGGAYEYRKAFDTLRAHVERCNAVTHVEVDFPGIADDCNGLDAIGDTSWADCRNWLKKVLPYQSYKEYVCADLAAYAGTFAHRDELGNPQNFRTQLAILTWLADSSVCGWFKPYLGDYWNVYHRVWKDTVTDSLKTPFDSTLPSLDQIGQTFLRGFAAGVADGTEGATKALRSLRADRNPFGGDADLTYVTSLPSITKIEVYDALGRQVWTDGQGYLDPGEHHLKIPTASWSAGAYYARLSTIRGEVLTTKLVFEK